MQKRLHADGDFCCTILNKNLKEEDCHKMCDNCKNPKEKLEVKLNCWCDTGCILDLNENYLMKTVMDYLMGRETKEMKDFRFTEVGKLWIGEDRDENFWSSISGMLWSTTLSIRRSSSLGCWKSQRRLWNTWKIPQPLHITINHDYDEGDYDADDEGGTAAWMKH